VRELKSILQAAVNLAQGPAISLKCLPEQVRKRRPGAAVKSPEQNSPILPFADVEKNHILSVYRQLGGNKVQTARVLGLGLNTLRRKLKSYQVQ